MLHLPFKIFLALLAGVWLVRCTTPTQTAVEPTVETVRETPLSTTEVIISTPIPTATAIDRFDCTTVGDIPTAECEALVAFYEATHGDQWVDAASWLDTPTACSWSGVTCVNGHVETLALFFNELQGPLPAALANLTQLRVLDLHNNALSGPLPPELGRLSRLEYLDLSNNQMGGSLPAAWGDLPTLEWLYLYRNQLSGPLPVELGRIVTLRNVNFSDNQLSGLLPESLTELSALEILRLGNNQLEGPIPFGLGELGHLTEIDLSFNQLTGTVPAALYQVPIHLLWGNQLEGTIFVDEEGQQTINYLGAEFTLDQAIADNVWPELVPAQPVTEGPGIPWGPPEHIVLTFIQAAEAQAHAPLGLYLPAEAQMHIYPAAGLNPEVQPIITALQQLLIDQPDLVAYEMMTPELDLEQPALTMLPPSNARQSFRAQMHYLTFTGGRGVRYLTQLSQGPVPLNNQELFYTFQGLTADGATYVAAYFPVTLPALPDSAQMDEAEYTALLESWPRYLNETLQMLNAEPAAAYTPDLTLLDGLINSLSVAGTTTVPTLEIQWPTNGESVDNQPILQWIAYPGAVRYEIVVVDDDVYPPTVALSQFTKATELPVTPMLEPGSYSWTVRALDGEDAVLAELDSQFLVKAALEAIGPAFGSIVAATPTLEWQSYPEVAVYQLIIVDDDAYPPVIMVDEETGDTFFTITDPLAPGSYSWTVWAKDANGRILAELASQFVVK